MTQHKFTAVALPRPLHQALHTQAGHWRLPSSEGPRTLPEQRWVLAEARNPAVVTCSSQFCFCPLKTQFGFSWMHTLTSTMACIAPWAFPSRAPASGPPSCLGTHASGVPFLLWVS